MHQSTNKAPKPTLNAIARYSGSSFKTDVTELKKKKDSLMARISSWLAKTRAVGML
ncbi:hypothetical protein QTP88_004893 [Uroleucon formosanum]